MADYGHIPRGRQHFVIYNRTIFRKQFDAAADIHKNASLTAAVLNAASLQNAGIHIYYIALQRLQ